MLYLAFEYLYIYWGLKRNTFISIHPTLLQPTPLLIHGIHSTFPIQICTDHKEVSYNDSIQTEGLFKNFLENCFVMFFRIKVYLELKMFSTPLFFFVLESRKLFLRTINKPTLELSFSCIHDQWMETILTPNNCGTC